eukprot:9225051-Karenia_brevis.AAC.1
MSSCSSHGAEGKGKSWTYTPTESHCRYHEVRGSAQGLISRLLAMCAVSQARTATAERTSQEDIHAN